MFDFAWSELALIGVVALVAIGPKDMPVAIKSVAALVKKARRMAGEFQGHFDELMREADLGEMRGHLSELRSFNLRDQVARAVDPDGSLRTTLAENPMMTGPTPATPVGEHPTWSVADAAAAHTPASPHQPPVFTGNYYHPPAPDHARPNPDAPPAFIPPDAVAELRARNAAPAFIPPQHATTAPEA